MKTINVHEQYYQAEALVNGTERRAALVGLTAETGGGRIAYRVFLTFFPHRDPEDFAVTGDGMAEKTLYEAQGRRSRRRERILLEHLRETADELADEIGGTVLWDRPIGEARNA